MATSAGIHGELLEKMLPSFWTLRLSRIFGDAAPLLTQRRVSLSGNIVTGSSVAHRRGKGTESEQRREKAKKLGSAGHSYGEIGAMMAVSKSQAFRLGIDR